VNGSLSPQSSAVCKRCLKAFLPNQNTSQPGPHHRQNLSKLAPKTGSWHPTKQLPSPINPFCHLTIDLLPVVVHTRYHQAYHPGTSPRPRGINTRQHTNGRCRTVLPKQPEPAHIRKDGVRRASSAYNGLTYTEIHQEHCLTRVAVRRRLTSTSWSSATSTLASPPPPVVSTPRISLAPEHHDSQTLQT
jgi:hypothetical protein